MKKSFLLCLLMTLFTTWAVQAAELTELTVHDGTAINSNVPMYVFYFDDFTRSQTVFPAEELADMKNESILSMKFYTSYEYAYTTAATVDIYLKEVEDAAISAFVNKSDATIVYQGTLDFVLEGGMATVTIEFTTPFQYNGGNLMFGCDNTTDPEYKGINFYGETVTDASIAGYNSSSLDNVSPSQKNFIPKTTFTYGTPPSCPKATGLTFTNVTADNATFSWDAISNVSAWNFAASTEADFPDDADKTIAYDGLPANWVGGHQLEFSVIKALFYGFSLKPNTTYYVKLQANCGADGLGDWSNVASFHTACEAFALPFSEDFEEGIDCWTMVDCKEGSYGTGINNAEKYEGSYSFKFAYNTTPPQYLISPEFVAIDKEVIVEFYYKKGGSYDETFAVGYSTTDNEVGSFTWGEEIHGQSTWEQYLETLPAGVKYVAVKYTANNQLSLYIDNFSVYAAPDCPKPTGLAVSNIEAHNATFSWTGESDLGWQLCLNDGEDDEFYNISANPFTFASAPLKAETEYTAKLRTLCEGDATSDWSNEVTFTTDIACYPPTFGAEAVSNLGATEATIAWDGNGEDYTLSYRKARYVDGLEETFGTSIPTGWTMYTGLYNKEEGTATLTASTYGWSFGNYNGVFDNHARVNIYGNYQRWLVTPQFVLEGSSLEFDLALTAFSGTLADPQTTGDDDKFLVLLSEDKETWKVLAQWDNVGTEFSYNDIAHTASGQHVSLDLSDYEGSNIYIAFYGESTVSNADNNLHIDNVLCGTVHEPTAWISESGITEKSKQITGLEPETKYDVKVQSNCGSDGMSEESEIISFTTTPTCVVPANLTASDITAHTATFDWESNGDAWQLSLSCSAGETVFNVDALPYSVETLDAETSYTVKVRTVCGEDYSDWSSTITFTTDVACPAPTNLEVELTPGDGKVASLLWAAGSAENWILQYSESAAFEPAQEITVNGNSFYDLDDLTPETTYFARVKAVCGGIDGESAWSEPISFTPTNAYAITINEGTTTNTEVPVYGSWTDAHSNSQFIIPASTLEEIQYAQLTQLTFYANNTNISWGAAQFEVYVLEVNETTISSLYAWDDLEKVMTAANLSIVNGQMVVTFDAPYQYMGGNLLIGIYQTTSGTYTGCSWYGISATGAALGGYTSNSGSLSVSAQNFLPKMTINYIPGEAPSCPKPTGLTIEYNGGTEAIVSWTSDAESWNLEYGDALININQNPYTIQNLPLATTYQVRVQALCSEENASDWTNVVEFTTDLCLPEDMKTITYKLTDSYNDGWNGSAALRVVHKTTNTEIASLTLASGASLEGSLDLCCGEEYSFIWKKGSYDTECGFEIYDINGDIILSKEGCNTGCESPDDGAVLLDYTMNCSSGETPTGVEDVKNDAQVYKFVKDGNLFILHNGKLFNAQGKFVK